MNIFVLSTNPVEAAHFHCDQHLHKMILESAQMLSTAAHSFFSHLKGHIYAPAYQNHPCTQWVCESPNHMVWVCVLATTLNEIREDSGSNRHSSMDIIEAIADNLNTDYILTDLVFAEAMYPHIKIRTDLTTVQKYQLYYRKKHEHWLLTKGKGMSYKGRAIPEFMAGMKGISGG